MATANLPHGFDPHLVTLHLNGVHVDFHTRAVDYLLHADVTQAQLDAAVAATIAGDIEPVRAQLRARIKAIASEVILGRVPQWKQSNMLAASQELAEIREVREHTPAEAAVRGRIRAIWDWAKSVRSMSDEAEAELATLDLEQLRNWQPPEWPAWIG